MSTNIKKNQLNKKKEKERLPYLFYIVNGKVYNPLNMLYFQLDNTNIRYKVATSVKIYKF